MPKVADRVLECGDAGGAQGTIGNSATLAQSLDDAGRAMTDAIDRKEHGVGSFHEVAEDRPSIFNAAIMVEQGAVLARHQLLEPADRAGRPPDIKQEAATKAVFAASISSHAISASSGNSGAGTCRQE